MIEPFQCPECGRTIPKVSHASMHDRYCPYRMIAVRSGMQASIAELSVGDVPKIPVGNQYVF